MKTQIFEVYGCSDCSGCGHKAKYFYKYDAEKDAEKNKVMKIKKMTVFDVSITGHPKKYIKNSCCMRLEEI